MTSKRRLRRRACTGKHRYPDEATARAAIWRQRRRWDGFMRAYRCSFCGGWHIGHAPRRQKHKTPGFRGFVRSAQLSSLNSAGRQVCTDAWRLCLPPPPIAQAPPS